MLKRQMRNHPPPLHHPRPRSPFTYEAHQTSHIQAISCPCQMPLRTVSLTATHMARSSLQPFQTRKDGKRNALETIFSETEAAEGIGGAQQNCVRVSCCKPSRAERWCQMNALLPSSKGGKKGQGSARAKTFSKRVTELAPSWHDSGEGDGV